MEVDNRNVLFSLEDIDSFNITDEDWSIIGDSQMETENNTSTDDSSDSITQVIVRVEDKRDTTKARKGKRKLEDNPRAQFYLPRIPRRDIRRQYTAMFANVYNSHDFGLMKQYSDTFFYPDVTLLFRKLIGTMVLGENECKGAERGVMLWYDTVNMIPDMVFSLQKSQIKVRSDGTAVVSSSFTMSGTKVISSNVPVSALYSEMHEQLNPQSSPSSSADGLKQKLMVVEDKKCMFKDLIEGSDKEGAVCDPSQLQHQLTKFDRFEQEFSEALVEYLHEDSHSNNSSNNNANVVGAVSPVYPQVMTKSIQSEGHFALHLDAEGKIFYISYALNCQYEQ